VSQIMLSPALLSAYLLLAAAAGSTPALCIAIDTTTDQLTAEERQTGMALLSQAVAAWGSSLAPEGCADPWLLSHVKVAGKLSISLRGPAGAKLGLATGMDQLAETYLDLLRGSEPAPQPWSPPEIASAPPDGKPTKPTPVAEPARRPLIGFGAGHGQWYVRLGYHGTVRNEPNLGPSLGLGYRFEYKRAIFDVSTLDVNFWRATPYDNYRASWNAYLRLMAFRYLDDILGANLYAGGGFSYGELDTHDGYHADGLQAELGVGYELLRGALVRTFVQVVTTLPTFKVYSSNFAYPDVYRADYAFSTVASVGVGF
jgi:hypothetical protein